MIKHPNDIQWIEGELPDVHTVPYTRRALAWLVYDKADKPVRTEGAHYKYIPAPELDGQLKTIVMVSPWQDQLNPLRWWCTDLPIGYQEKVKFYAWIN